MALIKKMFSKEAEISSSNDADKPKLTRVVVRFDVGFNNHLFIRGNGANLNWNKGVMMRNTRSNEWVWETNQPFKSCEFKVLINDTQYEQGNNHVLSCEKNMEYTPHF